MEKKMYSIKWTQAYTTWPAEALVKDLRNLSESLIEQVVDAGEFKEANALIAHIKSL